MFQNLKISFLQDYRYRSNFIFGMLTPIFTIIPIFFTVRLFNLQREIEWYLKGIVIWFFISQIIWGNGVILKREKDRGTLEQLLLVPKNIIYFVINSSIYFILKAYVSMVFIIFISNITFGTQLSVLMITYILLLGFPFYYSLSMLVSFLCINVHNLFPILQVILASLMIFSGLTYDISFFSQFIYSVNRLNSLYHMISLARISNQINVAIILTYEALYLLITGVISLILVILLTNRYIRKFKINGRF
ncbi:MAG: ABC transporter permease [Defluviitaleaceae bacterium]|nr:ABC transporter permease [Defluviitaleaceae bacterium]